MEYYSGKIKWRQILYGIFSILFIYAVWIIDHRTLDTELEILKKGQITNGTLIKKGTKGRGTYQYFINEVKFEIIDRFISTSTLEIGEVYNVKYLSNDLSNGIVDFCYPVFDEQNYIPLTCSTLEFIRKDELEDYALFKFSYLFEDNKYTRFQYILYKDAMFYEYKAECSILIKKGSPQIAYLNKK